MPLFSLKSRLHSMLKFSPEENYRMEATIHQWLTDGAGGRSSKFKFFV